MLDKGAKVGSDNVGIREQQLKTRAAQTGRQQLLMEEKEHRRLW
ncbi:hypothetical protein [Pasteuria penetrans]|nr:hypothetical protein [Pasteuria penetrans]